ATYADILLPATSQFEHWDLHKGYGHLYLSLNRPAMAPLGECKSNWEVMGLLARRMGYADPEFDETPEEIIRAILAHGGPVVEGTTGGSREEKASARRTLPGTPHARSAAVRSRPPGGKREFFPQHPAAPGGAPRRGGFPAREGGGPEPRRARRYPLQLVSPA